MCHRLLILAVFCGVIGLTLFCLAALWDKPPASPLAGGVLIVTPRPYRAFHKVVREPKAFPDAIVLPVRFVGMYETKGGKAYQRRYLTVLVGDAKTMRRVLPVDKPLPIAVLGDGVPQNFAPKELVDWKKELSPFANPSKIWVPASERALKWTVLLVTDLDKEVLPSSLAKSVGLDAFLILSPRVSVGRLRNLVGEVGQPLLISMRLALRPAKAFWTAWLGIVLLFASGHLFLWQTWQRWQHRPSVAMLIRERWLYHSIAAVYFSLYLTAVGVIYNRPDFQDALHIPLHPFGSWSPFRLYATPLFWLWNWLVQVVAVMLPSALIPPAGIVIGHMRGMVEQALTTAPIAQGGGMGSIVTALAVFWQGEATVVAMVWSALLTRAVTAPHTFGTDNYWQAYKVALRDFLPLAKLVGILTAIATALGMLT